MRRGTVTPELVLALAVLVLALLSGLAMARAVAAVWGAHRAAEAALQEVRLNGEAGDPVGAARSALAGTPLFPVPPDAAEVAVDPPAGWTFGRWVCVTVRVSWTAGGGLLPPLPLSPAAARCGSVERWP